LYLEYQKNRDLGSEPISNKFLNIQSRSAPVKLIENWFSERYSDNLQLSFRVKDQLLSVRTDFQRIDLFETYDFGKLLTIDGTVQLTEYDEHIYHEMITMLPFYAFGIKPESALVIGGGDGGTATSLLSLGFKKVTNVEIDSQVVEVSKKFFPNLSAAFKDSRCNLIIDDGIKYAKNSRNKFDFVLVDSTDPEGPAEGLFSEDFYHSIHSALKEGGVAVTQSGSPLYQPKAIKLANSGMKKAFKNVYTYCCFIPTYPSGFWSFTMGSDSDLNFRKDVPHGKYFNAEVLHGALQLPQFVRELIQ
jgi:spermidine synthase